MHSRPPIFWVDIAVKAALVGLVLAALTMQDLPQFHGKAMTARAAAYPFAALIVPVVWWVRGGRSPYPYAIDILVVLPFLIDLAGNAANLYDRISWWDDANHFVNWAILVSAFALAILRFPLAKPNVAALCIGFGAVTAILWELIEYVTFIRNSPERLTAYHDTLGDLALGLSGSVLAAAIAVTLLWPQRAPAAG